ncbi:MAG TPA: hypothetical protein PKI93_08000 [Alphaproteobacteria bacterium]|nr:hypothetical protein [Alphaproteobacteria bacterium]HNS43774.1 hypothetical protein [Alphaproteobacteria bacterium]
MTLKDMYGSLAEAHIKMDELEESLRQNGWKSSVELLADRAAAEYAAYMNSIPAIRP